MKKIRLWGALFLVAVCGLGLSAQMVAADYGPALEFRVSDTPRLPTGG